MAKTPKAGWHPDPANPSRERYWNGNAWIGGLSSEETDGITRSQFDGIAQGDSQSSIEHDLGKPQDSQEFEQQITELQDQPSRSSCIYYPEKGKAILEGDSFQLCFDEGKLTSKNAY